LRTELFDYTLPTERIAQRPLPDRDGARLLVLREAGLEHRAIMDLATLIPAGALVVVNDTRVLRARLHGHRRPSGGQVEILLLRRLGPAGSHEHWRGLGRASKALRPGTLIDAGELLVEVLSRDEAGTLELSVQAEGDVAAALERCGHVPIPPYLEREDDAEDGARYQTVYARHLGSVAAPTAGLHLSTALLAALEARGIEVGHVTLHVGLGTFRPVTSDTLDEHVMHAEWLDVSSGLALQIAEARARGAPVVAVGTTVVRALESARDPEHSGRVRATRGESALFIRPGYRFGVVDALLTNFHMPRSSLLALVSAFAGRERLLAAYDAALAAGYRFLSYGDAMWIPARVPDAAQAG
jgi:S-adenosylmethionine:tRNA ribosyltransferase-isomerase